MYPEVPFDGISWPITQHAGVLSERSLDGLLRACLLCHGETVNPERINGYLVQNGILTANVRSDSNRIDAWRDYQQILSEFGLLYSTRISKVIRLTPVAMAYLNGNLTYGELITLQILRYQYPNGHKTQWVVAPDAYVVKYDYAYFGIDFETYFRASMPEYGKKEKEAIEVYGITSKPGKAKAVAQHCDTVPEFIIKLKNELVMVEFLG